MITRHYIVTGKVQGVWYRNTTQQIAIDLGLTGWVKNLTDGSVEIVATGQSNRLNKFEAILWQGPEASNVKDIDINEVDLDHFDDFRVIV